jgi:hypothetical protein
MTEHSFEAIAEEDEQQAKKDLDDSSPVSACSQPAVVNAHTMLENVHATPSPTALAENGGEKEQAPTMTTWYTNKCNSQTKDNGVTPCRRQASSSLESTTSY